MFWLFISMLHDHATNSCCRCRFSSDFGACNGGPSHFVFSSRAGLALLPSPFVDPRVQEHVLSDLLVHVHFFLPFVPKRTESESSARSTRDIASRESFDVSSFVPLFDDTCTAICTPLQFSLSQTTNNKQFSNVRQKIDVRNNAYGSGPNE